MDEKTTDAPKEKDRADTSTTTMPADPVDDIVTTEHTLRIGRAHLAYTATTGRIVLREEVYEDGAFTGLKAKAEVSITAYVAAASGDTPRPVTFAFNGGPGSSSVWLHLGLMGPRRVVSGDVGSLAAPPYGLTDNLETLLRSTGTRLPAKILSQSRDRCGFSSPRSGFPASDRGHRVVAHFYRHPHVPRAVFRACLRDDWSHLNPARGATLY